MDEIASGLNLLSPGAYVIKGRTKAMVACYPGKGTHYQRHVDNPSEDGRLITCIMYMNADWDCSKDGGNLRIFPSGLEHSFYDIEPKMNRMLFFWSDSRIPHEVFPAYKNRYAITVWYFDEAERAAAKKMASVNKDLDAVRAEVSAIDLKKIQMEKEFLEQKIENEAMKAVQSLSESELEALCTLVADHPNPPEALEKMGIGKAISASLLKVINKRRDTKQ